MSFFATAHFRGVAVAIVAALGLFLASQGPSQVFASSPTVTIGTLQATGDPLTFTFDVALSGYDATKTFDVELRASVGQLSLATITNLVRNEGYPAIASGTPSQEWGFHAAYADVAAALQGLGYSTTDVGLATEISVVLSERAGDGIFYFAAGDRYYKQVTSANPITWEAAKAGAEVETLFGLTGYLATLTSAAENSFVADKTTVTNVWIGAGRRDVSVFNSFADNPGLIFEWKTGPEVGVAFSTQRNYLGSPSGADPIGGLFTAWDADVNGDGEPNNYQYPGTGTPQGWIENFVVTNWQGSKGKWNDLPSTAIVSGLAVRNYLVEFGGTGEFAAQQGRATCQLASATAGGICGAGQDSGSSGGSNSPPAAAPVASRQLAATGVQQAMTNLLLFAAVGGTILGVALVRGAKRSSRSDTARALRARALPDPGGTRSTSSGRHWAINV